MVLNLPGVRNSKLRHKYLSDKDFVRIICVPRAMAVRLQVDATFSNNLLTLPDFRCPKTVLPRRSSRNGDRSVAAEGRAALAKMRRLVPGAVDLERQDRV